MQAGTDFEQNPVKLVVRIFPRIEGHSTGTAGTGLRSSLSEAHMYCTPGSEASLF